jgi:CHASE2 domain-containing sensor protein
MESSNPPQQSPQTGDSGRRMRFLNIIAWVAVVDVLLLIPLVWASRWVADRHEIVSVLGPIHGFLFLVLIGLCAYGSLQKWWGWWFPVLVVVTLGPLGSLIGDWIIRRQLKAESGTAA